SSSWVRTTPPAECATQSPSRTTSPGRPARWATPSLASSRADTGERTTVRGWNSRPSYWSRHADRSDREDLDGRRARPVGRGEGPRPDAHAPLRLGRLRGHPRLPDVARPGGVPAH